jgi:hypothetical protein
MRVQNFNRVYHNVWDQMSTQMNQNMRGKITEEVRQMRTQKNIRVWNKIYNQMWNQVRTRVYGKMWSRINEGSEF